MFNVFLCFRASPGKPVFNVTTLWTVGYSSRQSLQKCEVTESVYKELKKSVREPSYTWRFDSGTALSPCGFSGNVPQSLQVHECGRWDWAHLFFFFFNHWFFLRSCPSRGSVEETVNKLSCDKKYASFYTKTILLADKNITCNTAALSIHKRSIHVSTKIHTHTHTHTSKHFLTLTSALLCPYTKISYTHTHTHTHTHTWCEWPLATGSVFTVN